MESTWRVPTLPRSRRDARRHAGSSEHRGRTACAHKCAGRVPLEVKLRPTRSIPTRAGHASSRTLDANRSQSSERVLRECGREPCNGGLAELAMAELLEHEVSERLRREGSRWILGSLLLLVALNAFGGGYYGMAGAPNVPTEWLEGSPFTSYFLPSLILA